MQIRFENSLLLLVGFKCQTNKKYWNIVWRGKPMVECCRQRVKRAFIGLNRLIRRIRSNRLSVRTLAVIGINSSLVVYRLHRLEHVW